MDITAELREEYRRVSAVLRHQLIESVLEWSKRDVERQEREESARETAQAATRRAEAA